MPIQRVLAAAGVDLYARLEQPANNFEQSSLAMLEEEEDGKWMKERNQSLVKLRDKKYLRRAGESSCGADAIFEILPEKSREELAAGARSSAKFNRIELPNIVTTGRLSMSLDVGQDASEYCAERSFDEASLTSNIQSFDSAASCWGSHFDQVC